MNACCLNRPAHGLGFTKNQTADLPDGGLIARDGFEVLISYRLQSCSKLQRSRGMTANSQHRWEASTASMSRNLA
jgi:hypothetical protein